MMSTNRVKEFRLARAWSQEQLAEMAALSVRTIQRIENQEQPSLETLSALAAVFEVSVSELSGSTQSEGDEALDQRITEARKQLEEESRFYRSVLTAVVVCVLLSILNRTTSPESVWSLWVAAIWGALLVVRGLRVFVFGNLIAGWQKKRLQKLLRK
ncbi:2TM domain-containing protein [Phytobacter ursingii]